MKVKTDPGGYRDVGSGTYRWLSEGRIEVTLLPGDRLGITGCACVGPGKQTLGVFCNEGIACPCGELVAVPARGAPGVGRGARWLGTDRELALAAETPPRPHAGPGWCACGLPDPAPHAEGDGPYVCVCGGLLRPAGCRCCAPHAEPCRRPRSAPLGALRKVAP